MGVRYIKHKLFQASISHLIMVYYSKDKKGLQVPLFWQLLRLQELKEIHQYHVSSFHIYLVRFITQLMTRMLFCYTDLHICVKCRPASRLIIYHLFCNPIVLTNNSILLWLYMEFRYILCNNWIKLLESKKVKYGSKFLISQFYFNFILY